MLQTFSVICMLPSLSWLGDCLLIWVDRLLGVSQVKTRKFRERAMARRKRRQGKCYLGEKDRSVEQKSSLVPVCWGWSLCLDCLCLKTFDIFGKYTSTCQLDLQTISHYLHFMQSDKKNVVDQWNVEAPIAIFGRICQEMFEFSKTPVEDDRA